MTIALEEHVLRPGGEEAEILLKQFAGISRDRLEAVIRPLEEVGEQRLGRMTEGGVDVAVLSHSASFEILDEDEALGAVRRHNDWLAEVVRDNPGRYAAFSAVALHDPVAGADELERAVTELGMVGTMVYGAPLGIPLDDRRYDPFWERLQALDVPVYFHPYYPKVSPPSFDGRPELTGAVWGWNVEVATQFLRCVFAGTFDRYPGAQVILGHMGESLPYLAFRIDQRTAGGRFRPEGAKTPSQCMSENMHITTSGVFDDRPMRCAVDTIGLDRVMYSVDYPYESYQEAHEWFSRSGFSAEELTAIGSENARSLLRLP